MEPHLQGVDGQAQAQCYLIMRQLGQVVHFQRLACASRKIAHSTIKQYSEILAAQLLGRVKGQWVRHIHLLKGLCFVELPNLQAREIYLAACGSNLRTRPPQADITTDAVEPGAEALRLT